MKIPPRVAVLGLVAMAATAFGAELPIVNVDLSGEQPQLAAAVPVVAFDPGRAGRIAVAWRFIDPLGGSLATTPGNWVCHLSISQDGGGTFRDHAIDWQLDSISRCNAPWAGYSRRGDLYAVATLTAAPPAHAVNGGPNDAAPVPAHPYGTAGFIASRDGGDTFGATRSVLPSEALERFDTDPSIPAAAKHVPWDGARGAVDWSNQTIYLSGAFPARPGGSDHSQRFYSVSTDGGNTFGTIRAFGNAQWPERWDGDIAAAKGLFIVSYIADSTPTVANKCPCAVIAVSHDQGKTLRPELVATADEFDLDMLVHYPEVAADPAHQGRFAVVLISAQKSAVTVYLTADEGKHWTRLTAGQSAAVTSVTRPAVAFSPNGTLVVAWRGVHADASYDLYAAASGSGKNFGSPLRVSTASSRTPSAWLPTYAVRGDFHTTVAAAQTEAHFAWADARNGNDVRAYYAHVSLRRLLSQ